MSGTERNELERVARALASEGIVRICDVHATDPLVCGLDAERVTDWAASYGYSPAVAELVAIACNSERDVRLIVPAETMQRAYTAAVVWVLAVRRKQYNKGQLAELAAAILLGLFPAYGIANNRPAATDEPDLLLGSWGMSCKDVLDRCTYAKDDQGERLFAMLRNTGILYVLTRATWAELEANYTEIETSRGTKRSPRSKKSIAAMVQWLDAKVALALEA